MTPSILQHIKVLDLTRVVAGPMATQMLADLGATVYKIEKPGEGDDTRRMGPFVTLQPPEGGPARSESAAYHAYNRGKQSVTLDLADPRGAALAQALALRCDVVIENYKVGTLARYGLDAATLRAQQPGLIYCSITGFGQSGPYATRPAYDFITQGLAGLMSTCGEADGPPMRTAIPIIDAVTGLYATVGIVSALYHRQLTGQGQTLDMALLDASVALNGHLAQGYLMGARVPHRAGNSNPIAAPSEVFACADGDLIVAAGNNLQFKALTEALGKPELASDPRFASNTARIEHRQALRQQLAPAIARHTRAELSELMARSGVPSGPINRIDEVFADAQVQHRELVQHLGGKTEGPEAEGAAYPVIRSPLRFSHTPVRHEPSPGLGQHTDAVLQGELGLTAQAVAQLRALGVV